MKFLLVLPLVLVSCQTFNKKENQYAGFGTLKYLVLKHDEIIESGEAYYTIYTGDLESNKVTNGN